MKLTMENYHSLEANQLYMSASRYKRFAGSLGQIPCEAKAVAMFRGEWFEGTTPAMLMSSYVDQHFSETLDIFKAQNPSIFTSKGELKAQFKHAETIIARIERDAYFMQCLAGKKQQIMTANFCGVDWSIMIDSFHPDIAIFDLKVMAEINKSHWVKDWGHMTFVDYYGYRDQGAIYQKVVEINTGKTLPFYLAVASKQEEPDITVLAFTQEELDDSFSAIENNLKRINSLRSGEKEPDKCGRCNYCRKYKVLSGPIHYQDIIFNV